MKIWQSQHVFDHPWQTITRAVWQKYPNPSNPNVVAIDVVDREVSPDGTLCTQRVFTTKWAFPRWVMSIIPISDHCYSTERSIVNPTKKTMILESRNISLGNFITVDEKLEYKPHPTDPRKTLLTQEAQISINGLPLVGKLEEAMANAIASQAGKGRQAMECVVKKITTEAADLGRSFDGINLLKLEDL